MNRYLASLCLCVSFGTSLFANDKENLLKGHVDSVAHGDTFVLVADTGKRHVVHLRATDSPDEGQPFSNESKEALSKLIAGKNVEVHWSEKDRAGRVVGDAYIDDLFINLHIIEDGWAWYFKDQLESDELEEAEKEARDAGRGLWAQKTPVAPWEYRESKRVPVTTTNKSKKTVAKNAPEVSEPSYIPPVVASSSSTGGTVHVKGHYRHTKSGKTVYVKPHTRRK